VPPVLTLEEPPVLTLEEPPAPVLVPVQTTSKLS
jgi:hypothetical protein